MFTDRVFVHESDDKCRMLSCGGSYLCQFGGLTVPFLANHLRIVASCERTIIIRIPGCDDWCTVPQSTSHPPSSWDSPYIESAPRLSEHCFLVERPGHSGTANPGYTGKFFLWGEEAVVPWQETQRMEEVGDARDRFQNGPNKENVVKSRTIM